MKKPFTLLLISILLLSTLSVFSPVIKAEEQEWIRYEENPVIDGTFGAWDEMGIRNPCVLKINNEYMMWYMAEAQVDGSDHIGVATSADGKTWVKYAGNPVISAGSGWKSFRLSSPIVVWDDGIFKMWYGGQGYDFRTRIGYAESVDGFLWTESVNNPIIDLGATGEWDDYGVAHSYVLKEEGVYKMWYSGRYAADKRTRMGYATSSNGIDWVKYAENPVIELGDPETCDSQAVTDPYVSNDNGQYLMWYAAVGYAEQRATIAYAISDDGLFWEKSLDNPVLEPISGSNWENIDVASPTIVEGDGILEMWYTGRSIETTYMTVGYAQLINLGTAPTPTPTPTPVPTGEKVASVYIRFLPDFGLDEVTTIEVVIENIGDVSIESGTKFDVTFSFWDYYQKGIFDSAQTWSTQLERLLYGPLLLTFILTETLNPDEKTQFNFDVTIPQGQRPSLLLTDTLYMYTVSSIEVVSKEYYENVYVHPSDTTAHNFAEFCAALGAKHYHLLAHAGISFTHAYLELSDEYFSKMVDEVNVGNYEKALEYYVEWLSITLIHLPSEQRQELVIDAAKIFKEEVFSASEVVIYFLQFCTLLDERIELFEMRLSEFFGSSLIIGDWSNYLIIRTDPVNLLIVDPEGNKLGYDPEVQKEMNEIINGCFYGLNATAQIVFIPNPILGEYEVYIQGTTDEEYGVRIEVVNGTEIVGDIIHSGDISQDQVLLTSVNIEKDSENWLISSEEPIEYSSLLLPLNYLIIIAVVLMIIIVGIILVIWKKRLIK